MGVFLHSVYVVWVLLGLNHLSTLTHSLNAHNSKIKAFPRPNLPESVSECGFEGMLVWNSLKWNPFHPLRRWLRMSCVTVNGWACVNVHVTQLSQVSHLRGNALVSSWAALTVIRTSAKHRPGGEGQGKQHCCWEVLRSGGGGPTGTEFYGAPSRSQKLSSVNWGSDTHDLKFLQQPWGEHVTYYPHFTDKKTKMYRIRHLAGGGVWVRIQKSASNDAWTRMEGRIQVQRKQSQGFRSCCPTEVWMSGARVGEPSFALHEKLARLRKAAQMPYYSKL